MTTDKNLPKPEHGTIQAQGVHEIKKESEADSTKKQTSFPPSLIAVQTIRTVIEFTLVLPLLPLLSDPLGIILFLPFGLHFYFAGFGMVTGKERNSDRLGCRNQYL